MKQRTNRLLAALTIVTGVVAMLTSGCGIMSGPLGPPVVRSRPDEAISSVERIAYHGWNNALRVRNSTAEVIIVPEVGRVMSFRFSDGENVFWEDRSLDGQRGNWDAKEWINFGGDKTWPAPEGEWGNYTKHKEWKPPPAFDALPVHASIDGPDVTLTSPIDPFYQVRTIRRVHLYSNILQIATSYERVGGDPSKIGVWVITQFKDPVAIYVPAKTNSIFAKGHFIFSDQPWTQLQATQSRLVLTRDQKAPHKMGCDADQLLWVGEKEMCLVSSPRVADAEYPDRGASAEVYTNPDPKKYIELEMLGPVSLMAESDRISQTSIYTLLRRTQKNAEAELRSLGW